MTIFKLIPILFCTNLIWASATLRAEYHFKSSLDLKKYNESFIELVNSRTVQGNLNITLNHTVSKSESYNVRIKTTDIEKMTPLSFNIAKNTFNIGANKLVLKDSYTNSELKNAFSEEIKKELTGILSKIDPNVQSAKNEMLIKEITFKCKNINISNKECNLEARVSLVSKNSSTKDNDLVVLVKHLNDVKSEMTKSGSDYDIGGYREFLDKCESLVKNALNSLHMDKKNTKIQALVEVRRMIINERVDSYEYTAIRAKSIVGFVDTIIKLI